LSPIATLPYGILASHRQNFLCVEYVRHAMNDIAPARRRLPRRWEAADYVKTEWGIPLSPRTMAKQAVVGGGPKFRKAGRVPLYDAPDLDEWAKSKLTDLVASTSELTSRHHHPRTADARAEFRQSRVKHQSKGMKAEAQ
jgi:hypothetical protein